MRKALSMIVSMLAIAIILASCSPSPRAVTDDDIAIINRLNTLMAEAMAAGKVDISDPMNLRLTEKYTASNGETLTEVRISYDGSFDLSEGGFVSVSMKLAGNVHGGNHSMDLNARMSVSISGFDYADYSMKIDGTPIEIPEEYLPDIPG